MVAAERLGAVRRRRARASTCPSRPRGRAASTLAVATVDQVDRLALERQPAGVDLGDEEDVVDEPVQAVGVALDDREERACCSSLSSPASSSSSISR